MQLYFTGAEVSSHLSLLRSCGVTRIAVSITNLVRQFNDLEHWATNERLRGMEWALYADSPGIPAGPALQVLQNAEVPPELVTGPVEWYEGTWLSNTDLLFLPIWDATDPSKLRDYTENYDGVLLPDSVVDNPTAVRQARASINRLGQLAALTGRSKGIERFDTLLSSAWFNVQRFGETQIWVGNRLTRLSAQDKSLKREKYKDSIAAMGVDPSLILMDDTAEVSRLAVLSWLALEQHLASGRHQMAQSSPPLVTSHLPAVSHTVVQPSGGVANGGSQGRHITLPVISSESTSVKITDDDGNEVDSQITTIRVAPEVLRSCNTCALAVSCPAHSPGAQCSYQIPVTLQSKPQLVGLLRAITEIQAQRVLMGRFSEEIQGERDPDVGKEMDRLFGMIAKWRDIEDNRDTIKMTLESKGDSQASMGVLSRLFGPKVGQNAVLLEDPIDSNEVIGRVLDVDDG